MIEDKLTFQEVIELTNKSFAQFDECIEQQKRKREMTYSLDSIEDSSSIEDILDEIIGKSDNLS